ncbi:hypothetical protein DERP_004144 [Dermatophagoides pteronyssinus]|uniref:Uncharacterized protein n=1 Tax=Dermatophagoides pteronyssinus TaxID=6956 RepID=A0ABQ8J8F3_DERPT|nr:hypothetical protein DERP_004144 [Dermatophagoides pteronyssinus]
MIKSLAHSISGKTNPNQNQIKYSLNKKKNQIYDIRFRQDLLTIFSDLQNDDDTSVRSLSIRSFLPFKQSDHAPLTYLHSKL